MRYKSVALLALASLQLAGCQSTLRHHARMAESVLPAAQEDLHAYASAQFASGKKALDEGQYAAAIIALRNVRHFPDHAAAAYNGLAIAYAQLGRPDLAETYFRRAVAEAPGDKRYLQNLTRFYAIVPVASVRTAWNPLPDPLAAGYDVLAASIQPRLIRGSPAQAAIRIESPPRKLQRISEREVRIMADQVSVEPRRRATAGSSTTTTPKGRRRNPAYAVRVAQLGHTGGGATAVYPIRVTLQTRRSADVSQ